MTKSLSVLFACGLVSCGQLVPKSSQSPDYQTKAHQGRSFPGQPFLGSKALSLTDQPYAIKSIDPVTQLPGKIQFSPERTPKVAKEAMEQDALFWLTQLEATLGLPASELRRTDSIEEIGRTIVLRYQRFKNDMIVDHAYVQLAYEKLDQDEVRLFQIINRSFGPIAELDYQSHSFSEQELADLTGHDLSHYRFSYLTTIVFPLYQFDHYDFHVAEIYQLEKDAELQAYIHVSTETGELLEIKEERIHAQIVGEGYVYSHDEEPVIDPLKFVNVDGESADEEGRTDATGSVQLALANSRTLIVDGSNIGGLNNYFQANFSTQDAINFSADLDQEVVDVTSSVNKQALNAYLGLQRVRDFVDAVSPNLNATAQTGNIVVAVGVRDNSITCNAVYSQSKIAMFAESNQCTAAANITDILYHEWGHGLDDSLGPTNFAGGITDSGLSEGIGDTISFLTSGGDQIGKGFLNNGNPIRPLTHTLRYQDLQPLCTNGRTQGCSGPHERGMVIGGSMYLVKNAMVKRYGPRTGVFLTGSMFVESLKTTGDILSAYDNLQLADGTTGSAQGPNFCLIRDAFANHGLTNDSSCEDSGYVATDLDLKISANDVGDNKISLSVEADHVDRVAVCLDDKFICLGSLSEDLAFEEKKPGEFLSEAALDPSANEIITVIGFKDGEPTGARAIRFQKRSNEND